MGQRAGGNLVAAFGQVHIGQSADLCGGHFEAGCAVLVVGGECAACEPVFDLGLYGFAGGEGLFRLFSVWEYIFLVCLGCVSPGNIVGAGAVECFYLGGVDSVLSAAVGTSAHTGDYGLYGGLEFGVIRACRGDYAVAIEACACKDGGAVGGVGYADAVFFKSEVGQDMLCRVVQDFALRVLLVECRYVQRIASLKQQVRVFEYGAKPVCRIYDFFDTNSSVVVAVYEFQGFLGEFESRYRTAEYRPQFLVKLSKVAYVFAALDAYSRHTAYRAVFPGIFFCRHKVIGVFVLCFSSIRPTVFRSCSHCLPFWVFSSRLGAELANVIILQGFTDIRVQ